MMVFWFFSSLVYLLCCLLLAGYSLLGLCVWPLATTDEYAAGKLILIYLLLLATVISGVFHGSAAVYILTRHGWRFLTNWTDLRALITSLAVIVLPFCLCRQEFRRPWCTFLIAVGGFVAQALAFFDATAGA